ncbi:hypothetical protein BIV23_16395 [Streptomyces monashensis]|uniref:Uncharacterized protein n=1 Tax=Streptomyces monashensis TaxID=1678012 RepID=A0A1S2QEQ3_9ACTN|nr:hypothetical protein BIV23_16395 [Streptomyces monashensis]
MDAGPGSFAELQRHTEQARLTALRISTMPADHSADPRTAACTLDRPYPPIPAPRVHRTR